MAGFGNLMQDVLWCFSQVKGTIDVGVTEGKMDCHSGFQMILKMLPRIILY
uniref:Uncharacterized protein n=1 Tax=Otus sunia TaxID=257818 RepID=A0A8C8AAA5_9STRI